MSRGISTRRARRLRSQVERFRCPQRPSLRHRWVEFGEQGNLWHREPASRCEKCGAFE